MIAEILGQAEAVVFLQASITNPKKTPFLFVGDSGVGRKFAARCFVRELFCTGTKQSSCKCLHCTQIRANTHPDLVVLEDTGIDAIRNIIEVAASFPSISKQKFFILDAVDCLSVAAANAFLKLLEEPPQTARFILLANSTKAVLPTIRSRCCIVPFRRLSEEVISTKLRGFSSEEKATTYARLAEGSLGRAIQWCGANKLKVRNKALDLLADCATGDVGRIFSSVDGIQEEGALGLYFLNALLRDALAYLSSESVTFLNQDVREKVVEVSKAIRKDRLLALWESLSSTIEDSNRTKIDIGFHLKSALARTFV